MEKIKLCILCVYITTYASDIIESSYYGQLNVPLGVTNKALRKIFLQKTKQLHPDKSNDVSSDEPFKKFMHMYTTLHNDQLKEEYNNKLAKQLLRTNNSYAHTLAAQLRTKINVTEQVLNLILCCTDCVDIDCFDSDEE